MEHYGKKSNPYRGIVIALFCVIAFSIGVFFLILWIVNRYDSHTSIVNVQGTLGFTGLISALTMIVIFFSHLDSTFFVDIRNRIDETRSLFGKVCCKEGIKYYYDMFVEDGGPIMYVVILMFITYVVMSIYGFSSFFAYYRG